MKSEKDYTHPDVGKTIVVSVADNEVSLTFITPDFECAESIANDILAQLAHGFLRISMDSEGPPEITEITETDETMQ